MKHVIPYNLQTINSGDIKSVVKTLKSDFLTQGPKNKEFSNKLKKIINIKNVIVVNSATSALQIACLALGLKKNEWLWTSANTFIASATCGIHCGANVDLLDINPLTNNICVIKFEKKLVEAKKNKKLPKIVVVVHFGGIPCEMDKIFKLSKKYKFKIIEDASHALGSVFKNSKIGDCKYSDFCIYSFHPIKTITTFEGGALLTKSSKLAQISEILSNQGIIRNINPKKKWIYDHKYLGFNFRLSDVAASLGISQLSRVKEFIKRRSKVAEFYYKNLSSLPLILPPKIKNIQNSFHLFVVKFKNNSKFNNRDNFYNYMRKNNVNVQFHYIPVYRHSYFKKMNFKLNEFKNMENYFKTAISLPIYPNLTNKELKKICNLIKNYFKKP